MMIIDATLFVSTLLYVSVSEPKHLTKMIISFTELDLWPREVPMRNLLTYREDYRFWVVPD